MHIDSEGQCALDPAIAVSNPEMLGGNGNWSCGSAGTSTYFGIQFNPDGTGWYTNYNEIRPPGQVLVQGTTWQEGSMPDSISITGGSIANGGSTPFIELLSIVPTPAVFPTDMTATFVEAGNPSLGCQVKQGSLAPPGGTQLCAGSGCAPAGLPLYCGSGGPGEAWCLCEGQCNRTDAGP
jgi:hypothetical protein